LFNLLSNAVKFTDRGGVIVSGSIEDDQLHVAVADTGIGMRTEDMDRILSNSARWMPPMQGATKEPGWGWRYPRDW